MALWRVAVRKAINILGVQYKWSNLYFVESLSDLTAAEVGLTIWDDAERLFHKEYVFCYEVYASSVTEGDSIYTILPHGAGATSYGAIASVGEALPMFNVVRVDLPVASGGRPSRKFYRPPLHEADQASGSLSAGSLLTGLATGMAALTAVPELRDESGNSFSGYTLRGITARRLGKTASVGVPSAPTV